MRNNIINYIMDFEENFDFEAFDLEEEPDYFGKGKYEKLQFWGRWC